LESLDTDDCRSASSVGLAISMRSFSKRGLRKTNELVEVEGAGDHAEKRFEGEGAGRKEVETWFYDCPVEKGCC